MIYHILKYRLKVSKKTDAHMRNFSNVKNQSFYYPHAHLLYAQNAPDCVDCGNGTYPFFPSLLRQGILTYAAGRFLCDF